MDRRDGADGQGRVSNWGTRLSTYQLFKIIHVLTAAAWLGAGIMFHLLFNRARHSRDARMMASLSRSNITLGRAYFSPLSVLTLVSGIVMVLVSPLRFTDAWILIGFGGIVVGAGLAMGMMAPSSKRLIELIEERGTVDVDVKAAARRGVIASRISILVLIVVIWAMVAKPGF